MKIPSRSGVCVQGKWQKYSPPSPLLSKQKEIKNIGHSMSIRSLIFGVNSVTVSDLIHYDSFLQNATDAITKCDSYFVTKRDRSLLQNASGFLLQNVTVITKCDVYYKLRQYGSPYIQKSIYNFMLNLWCYHNTLQICYWEFVWLVKNLLFLLPKQ